MTKSTITREPITHDLKIYPEFFSAVCTGVKRAELRKNDRDYRVGDTLHLMETPRGSCHQTGEFINVKITHIADVGEWMPGYVLLSVELQERRKADREPVAEVVSIYGDPEAFGEREIRPLVGIQQMPYGTKLYRHAQPAPEYPETLPCPVLLEPGLRFGKGIKTSTMLAALARRAVHESDLAALSPEERAEFQARIEDFKALIAQPAPVVLADGKLRELFDAWFASDCSFDLSPEASEADNIAWRESYWYVWKRCRAAMLQAGNSPVIPEGYVMVPKDLLSELRDWAHPEIEKYCEMWEGRRDSEFPALRKVIADADALLAASPQEVKDGK